MSKVQFCEDIVRNAVLVLTEHMHANPRLAVSLPAGNAIKSTQCDTQYVYGPNSPQPLGHYPRTLTLTPP